MIYLRDFPKTSLDMKALIQHGFSQMHGAYLIEEIYNREMETEDTEAEEEAQ